MEPGIQCCVPAPPSEHACVGREEHFGGLLSYVVQPPSSPKAAVILASDIHGFRPPLLRKLADKVAATGYFVVVPDFFDNDPFVPAKSEDPYASLPDWLSKHVPENSTEDLKKVIEVIKRKGCTSVGASGFCWGAKLVVELAKKDDLKAAVLLHPAYVTVEDMKVVKTPIAVLAAEMDHLAPPSLVKEYAAALELTPEVESFVHIFPGVAHGWTTRYDVNDENAVKRAEESHDKMLEWFGKFLL